MPGTIWKYQLDFGQRQAFELPIGLQVLDFKFQNDRPTMWLLHDNTMVKCTYWFGVFMTGVTIPLEAYAHAGTAISDEGSLVVHLFRLSPPMANA